MKRKILSILLTSVMVMTLFSSVCTVASAVTVRNLPSEGFVVESKTPQTLGRWDGYTGTVTDGANNSRIIAYSGTSTGSHISLTLPNIEVGANASAKPYILHLSYRIQNDRTNPAYITHTMRYKNSSGDNTLYNDIFVANTSQFTMNFDTSKNITTFGTSTYNYLDPYDYKFDLYQNLKTGAYQIYLNGIKWISAYDYETAYTMFSGSGNGAYTIHEYRVRVTGAKNNSWAFNLVNPCYEIYNQDVMMDDIIAATVSGMSNYLNATGPSDTAQRMIDSTSGTITLSPAANTDSSSYSATGVSSGAKLIWWTGNESQGTGHKPKFRAAGVVSGKEWFHMGFNITGSNVGVQLGANLFRTDNGNTTTWDILDAYTGSDYRVDYIFDLANSLCYLYYNNVFHSVKDDDFVKQIRQIQLKITTSTNFTISNISFKYYAKGVNPGDILIGYESRTKTTYDYIYDISGIKTSGNVITKMGGVCSVSGDNTNGYTLTPGSIDGNNGGFARMTLNYTEDTGIYTSTDDKVLLYTAYYNPSVVSSGSKHQVGIRGNNGYYWFLTAQNGAFYNNAGEYIKSYSTSSFYTINFIINNKDYKYYWLLDGVCFDSGTLYYQRQPLWNIAYTMWNTSDRIVLKNVQTTLYKNNYTLLAKTKPLLSRIYANLENCTVSSGTASVTTSYIANTPNSADANTKVIYGVYNSAGALLKYQAVNSASSYVNGSNLTTSVTVPTGGTTLKVFMWNMNLGSSIMTPIANVLTRSLQ
ncbi:MAG: hypothetical protein K5768_07765 [Firmicutes bacterium]|nr:hypothetical protein [Bacillota bacterium]